MSSPRVVRTIVGVPRTDQSVLKCTDPEGGRSPILRTRKTVEGYQIDFTRQVFQYLGQFSGVSGLIVNTFN